MTSCLRTRLIAGLFACAIGLFIAPTTADAQVDAVLAHCASGSAYDACLDTSAQELYVIDDTQGTVCRIGLSSFAPFMTSLGNVPHPYGPAAFPLFQPICRGIAYAPTSDSLYVLNSSARAIQQMNKTTGAAIGSSILLSVPGGAANLIGLTWDTINNTIWTRDVTNNELHEYDPATGVFLSSIPLPPTQDVIYGTGLHFVNNGGVGFFEIPYGDIFSYGADRSIRIDMSGTATGILADLSDVPGEPRGYVRAGQVVYVTTDTLIYRLTRDVPTLNPVSNLRANSDINGNITLTWTNNGSGAGGSYDTLTIRRDGVTIAVALAGDTDSYTDDPPDNLTVEYQVQALQSSVTASKTIDVRTGTGAYMTHTQFPGQSVYGLAWNPGAGELYASSFSLTSGLIYVYDADLNFLRTEATGIDRIRGVAYDTTRNLILFTREGFSGTVRRFSTATSPWTDMGSFTTGAITPTGITYDQINDRYVISDQGGQGITPRLLAVSADPTMVGSTVWTATPPLVEVAQGVSMLPADLFSASGYVLAASRALDGVIEDGRQLFPVTGFPASFEVPFSAMGNSALEPAAIRGIEDNGNQLYVANVLTGTIFKLLLSPGGSDFIRGDANNDATADFADAIYVLDFLYSGGMAPDCFDAADINDDGRIDLSDSLYLILHLFLSAPQPPAPYPAAGQDPTFVDPFGC